MAQPRIALGPVQYYWPAERLQEFYAMVAAAPVDIVYLGETVCSKRRALRGAEWEELADQLQRAGKEVVLSTLALVEAESERKALRKLCANGRFAVEANDIGALNLLAEHGLPFVAGPSVNIYNGQTLRFLHGLGLRRWVMPHELSAATLAGIQAERPDGVETEVLAYGRIPLAWSARCFTARHRQLQKDDCGECCRDDPEGLTVFTQEGEPFLALNGIQTQSAQTYNLLGELAAMRDLGVDILRISPQARDTERVIETFRACIDGAVDPAEGGARLEQWMPEGGPCRGYWLGEAGMRAAAQA